MKVIVAGDFCPQNRVADLFNSGDYNEVLGGVRNIVSASDYSVVNIECPITVGGESPIVKQGPRLHCSKNVVSAVKWAGFNCATLANNHFYDYGREGVENLLTWCKENDLDTVGGGLNLRNASQNLYKTINRETIAVINCCEHEFSIATESSAGSNPLNPIQQYYAIKEAREKSDYVLVIIHGGHEHHQLPSPRMVETYRFFIDIGADAVVNHHQHCFSGYELYKNKPIFYGIGNFCFDKGKHKNELWNFGYMVTLNFTQSGTSFEIIPYEQCGDEPSVKLVPFESVSTKLKELNRIISSENELYSETQKYYNSCSRKVSCMLEPSYGRIVRSAQLRGFLPSFISERWALRLYNYVICESHRDKVEYFLNRIVKKK